MRAFLAVRPVEPALTSLARLLAELGAAAPQVRWTTVPTAHLTLRFMAQLDPTRLSQLTAALGDATVGIAPFVLELGTGGAFPSWRAPRVIWLGTRRGGDELTQLAQRCDAALSCAGFGSMERGFHPHLSLGRPGQGRSDDSLRSCRRLLEQARLPAFPVAEIVLFESRLHPSGASHHPQVTLSLGGFTERSAQPSQGNHSGP